MTALAAEPETPWGYANHLSWSAQAHADWCRASGGTLKVSREGSETSLMCLLESSKWGRSVVSLSVRKGQNEQILILYDASYFEPTDRAIRRKLGNRNAEIETPEFGKVDGWQGAVLCDEDWSGVAGRGSVGGAPATPRRDRNGHRAEEG
jgi:hypothetical protein